MPRRRSRTRRKRGGACEVKQHNFALKGKNMECPNFPSHNVGILDAEGHSLLTTGTADLTAIKAKFKKAGYVFKDHGKGAHFPMIELFNAPEDPGDLVTCKKADGWKDDDSSTHTWYHVKFFLSFEPKHANLRYLMKDPSVPRKEGKLGDHVRIPIQPGTLGLCLDERSCTGPEADSTSGIYAKRLLKKALAAFALLKSDCAAGACKGATNKFHEQWKAYRKAVASGDGAVANAKKEEYTKAQLQKSQDMKGIITADGSFGKNAKGIATSGQLTDDRHTSAVFVAGGGRRRRRRKSRRKSRKKSRKSRRKKRKSRRRKRRR